MQERDWIHANGFLTLLHLVRKPPSPRKLRLCACATIRRMFCPLEQSCRDAIEIAEQVAEHTLAKRTLRVARRALAETVEEARQRVRREAEGQRLSWSYYSWTPETLPLFRAAHVIELVLHARSLDIDSVESIARAVRGCAAPASPEREGLAAFDEEIAQCNLVRDIFGNPFRPVIFNPEWQTDTAIAIAHAMYESREFSAMPILADALQDAGCDNEDILSHCRDGNQVHVRGCWVVDLVLGKE